MSAKHVPRYVNEFVGRHSLHDLVETRRNAIAAHSMNGECLRYTALVVRNGLFSGARG